MYQVYQCIMQSTPQLELVFLSMSATSCYCCDAEKGVERSQRSEQRTSAAIKAKKNSSCPWDMSLPFIPIIPPVQIPTPCDEPRPTLVNLPEEEVRVWVASTHELFGIRVYSNRNTAVNRQAPARFVAGTYTSSLFQFKFGPICTKNSMLMLTQSPQTTTQVFSSHLNSPLVESNSKPPHGLARYHILGPAKSSLRHLIILTQMCNDNISWLLARCGMMLMRSEALVMLPTTGRELHPKTQTITTIQVLVAITPCQMGKHH